MNNCIIVTDSWYVFNFSRREDYKTVLIETDSAEMWTRYPLVRSSNLAILSFITPVKENNFSFITLKTRYFRSQKSFNFQIFHFEFYWQSLSSVGNIPESACYKCIEFSVFCSIRCNFSDKQTLNSCLQLELYCLSNSSKFNIALLHRSLLPNCIETALFEYRVYTNFNKTSMDKVNISGKLF